MLRFAPSPTADMNINDLRIAIFNHIISKQQNEGLVIRIEDINSSNNIEGKDKEILQMLSLFSIDYDRAAHQSDSLKYHQKMAMQLLAQKKAFVCYCGDEKLEELKDEAEKKGKTFMYDGFCENLSDDLVLNTNAPFTVRIKKPEGSNTVDSIIILNHDKTPTYDYACAVDDMIMDISTVIRDEKYLSSAENQKHIRKSLGYDKEINYIHLSKIENEVTVKHLIDEGFLPSAIVNYLILLGNETPTEFFTLEEAINWFDINKFDGIKTLFDINELKLINKQHLQVMDDMRLSKILGFADTDIGKLAKVFLNDLTTIKDLKNRINMIFEVKSTCIGFEEEFVELKLCLADAPYFETLIELETYIIDETNLNKEKLSKPLAYILTGDINTSNIEDIYPLIKNYLGEITK